ncbi:MAG: DUF6048 family protein [Phocaeicola sp.]
MKKRITSRYFIVCLISTLALVSPLQAQNRATSGPGTTKIALETEEEVPFYQGINVGIDLFGIGSKLFGGDVLSSEVAIEVNLKNRYIPVVEIGYGQTETTNQETDIYYKTAAPYFRVGCNYNIMFKKPYLPGYLFVGARIAHSSFSYDVVTPGISDPNFGNSTIPISYEGVKSNATWGEFVVGLKTEVVKNLCLGLSARWKFPFSTKITPNSEPWYVPGFGTYGSSTIGLTYNISYNLPF